MFLLCINKSNDNDDQYRASDISRKKKQNFAGFSGGNSRKNRLISRDFRGKKVKIRGKNRQFPGFSREKSQNSRRNRLILQDFRGRKVKIRRKIGRLRGILAKKVKFPSFITSHFLYFFHWTVSSLIFCCVTVKTIYRDQNLPFRKFQPEKRLPKILGDLFRVKIR